MVEVVQLVVEVSSMEDVVMSGSTVLLEVTVSVLLTSSVKVGPVACMRELLCVGHGVGSVSTKVVEAETPSLLDADSVKSGPGTCSRLEDEAAVVMPGSTVEDAQSDITRVSVMVIT